MKMLRWLPPFLVIVLVSFPVFSQKEDDAVREKQRQRMALSDMIIADSRELRLAENRALVLARTGSSIWDLDQKRAQNLFQDAVNELIAAQMAAETEKRQGRQNHLLNGYNVRSQVLYSIANRDADFALKSFYRTRPADVERALASLSAKDQKIRTAGNDAYLAQNELNLEQNLSRQAADQNPEKAIALLQAALKKGVTAEALTLLKKLHEKNPAAATETGDEVIAQLLKKSFVLGTQPDYGSIQAAISFLSDHLRQRPATDRSFRFAASDMRSLADRMVAVFTDRSGLAASGYLQQFIPIAEKIRPDAVEKLRQITAMVSQNGFRPVQQEENYRRLFSSDIPVEQVIAEAPKYAPELRRQLYQTAANRVVASGDLARARQMLIDHFSDEALSIALEGLNSQHANYLMNQGRFPEAEALIDEFLEPTRFYSLISLADAAFSRSQAENKTFSLRVLEKARAALSPRPENSNEMQQMLRLISAYVRIEPTEAFNLLDGLMQQFNELMEAAVVVNGFQAGHNVRNGEMLLNSGSPAGIHLDSSLFRGLAQKDFDRTNALIGTFSRREVRLQVRQQMLETY